MALCKRCEKCLTEDGYINCKECNSLIYKTRKARRAAGLCRCGNQPVNGLADCEACRNKRLTKDRDAYKLRMVGQICTRCGAAPSIAGSQHCEVCKTKRKCDTAARHLKIKRLVFAAYGNKCTCCKDTEELFFQIDHINNDGAKHRKQLNGRKFYDWIVKSSYPSDLQILCASCNQGKQLNGGVCPHKTKGVNKMSNSD